MDSKQWLLTGVGAVVAIAATVGVVAVLSDDDLPDAEIPDAEAAVETQVIDGPGPEGAILARVASVPIEAPAGAVEMQVGTDPTLRSTPWLPVAASAEVNAGNTGYQAVFVRFRDASGVESDVTVLAADIARPRTGPDGVPVPTVSVVAPTTLLAQMADGHLVRGGIGQGDSLIGPRVDGASLDQAGWTVTGADGAAVGVTATARVTRPAGSGSSSGGDLLLPTNHWVFLELDQSVTSGTTYQVAPPNGVDVSFDPFVFDEQSSWSSSVHVNDVGYAPADLVKVAMLSAWAGTLGGRTFDEAPGFAVVDASGNEAFRGVGERRVIPDNGELGRGDLTGSAVWELDFTALDVPGAYRVCADGIGCSDPFVVRTDTWTTLAATVSRAMYHQRSGLAIGPPYSPVVRPETYTEAAGVTIRHSDLRIVDTLGLDPDTVFEMLVAGGTDQVLPTFAGGHFDAGDWDRRIQHLSYVRAAIDVYESNPALWQATDFTIPESGDAIPDLLDEALWTLDFFRSLQGDDGGVRGGVEAVSHPLEGAVSWNETLDVYAFAPDAFSSYSYAGVAADMALALADLDAEASAAYQQSAIEAFAWADSEPVNPDQASHVTPERGTAAAALFRLTGDEAFHDVFRSVEPFTANGPQRLECHGSGWCEAAWIYLRIDPTSTDPGIRSVLEESMRISADAVLEVADSTAFGWTVEDPGVPLRWGLGPGGAPKVTTLLRAHRTIGGEEYLTAALQSASVSLGMNPTNQVMMTGVGERNVLDPLIVDVNNGGSPVWSGTPVYGPHQVYGEEYWIEQFFFGPAGVTPSMFEVPYLWSWFDIHVVAAMNEFTVFQSHGPALFAYGTFAGLSES